MFFRTKTIKGTPLVQLVESYRNAERQPRQRVIASLGDAKLPDGEAHLIARAVEDRLAGQPGLMEPELSGAAADWVTRILKLTGRSQSTSPAPLERIDGVLLDGIATENVVQLGPQLVALKAWEELGLSTTLAKAGLNASQIATAQLLVANRLIEPLSEWALIGWAERTALPEMLDIRVTKSTKDRLYLAGDALFKARKQTEAALRTREENLFGQRRGVILYDVTNTHFEGLCAGNPKARHGKNKQKRTDCRQVAVGMAFDERGLPLAHEVFEGNIAESTTLARMLDRLLLPEEGEERSKPVIILDAGFASAANLALLKERGLGYLINVTRGHREQHAAEFASGGFEPVPGREPGRTVEVKAIDDPENPGGSLVLCRSAQRREKELAMLSQAEERFLADVKALQKRVSGGKLKDPGKIERAVGRLQKKHPRAARFHSLQVEDGVLTASPVEDKRQQAGELCGDYVLRTDRELGAAQVWSLYMTLLQAEEGYACLKGSLGLRPNFHQTGQRVEAHIFISVLGYHLLCWVRERLRESGDNRDWKTLRRLLSTHSLVTTVLPLEDGRVLRVRKPSVPDPEQALVFKRLGIDWKTACPALKTFTQA
jgi:transposase